MDHLASSGSPWTYTSYLVRLVSHWEKVNWILGCTAAAKIFPSHPEAIPTLKLLPSPESLLPPPYSSGRASESCWHLWATSSPLLWWPWHTQQWQAGTCDSDSESPHSKPWIGWEPKLMIYISYPSSKGFSVFAITGWHTPPKNKKTKNTTKWIYVILFTGCFVNRSQWDMEVSPAPLDDQYMIFRTNVLSFLV